MGSWKFGEARLPRLTLILESRGHKAVSERAHLTLCRGKNEICIAKEVCFLSFNNLPKWYLFVNSFLRCCHIAPSCSHATITPKENPSIQAAGHVSLPVSFPTRKWSNDRLATASRYLLFGYYTPPVQFFQEHMMYNPYELPGLSSGLRRRPVFCMETYTPRLHFMSSWTTAGRCDQYIYLVAWPHNPGEAA